MKYAIVLAAGRGTRMKSAMNKVMHPLLHKPILGHVIDNLEKATVDKTVVVTGYEREQIESYLGERVESVTQDEQLGTKDAVSSVTQLKDKKGSTLIIFGDCGLVQTETINEIFEFHQTNGNDLTIVSSKVEHPGTTSRISRDNQGEIHKIVDYRNLNEAQQEIHEINLGVYCVNNELLYRYLPEIQARENEELNIIDLVAIMKANGHRVHAWHVEDPQEFLGINDRKQLLEANQWLQRRTNERLLDHGVTLLDPATTYIGVDAEIAPDVLIYPNVHIYGTSKIAEGTEVLPNSWLDNAVIGSHTHIKQSTIVDSTVGDYSRIGPYAHLRNHTEVGNHARVGNFVEFKNTHFADHSSSAHLTYLGDTKVGEHVNIGCGVITANYDGHSKSETTIGDHTFVGSNATLVAPITIGDNVLVAAGSTVVEDVPDDDMVIARSRQVLKKGYGKKYIKKEEA